MRRLTDYEGRPVRLTEERLAHIREHPEMQGFEDRIAETLRRPERVLESLSDPAARLYYCFYMNTRVGNKHLCVVVRVAENDAFVLTAYLTARRTGGRQLWPRES
ncbi:MAG: PBECR2 nuclease fold domain-containing protein [Burkholderiales bacterium]